MKQPDSALRQAFDDGRLHCHLTPMPRLQILGPIWADLEERAAGSFFTSWPWIHCWLTGLTSEPMLFQADLDGQAVALGIITVGRRRALLNQTGRTDEDSVYTEYNGLLCDRNLPGLEAACWRPLADAAAAQSLLGGGYLRLERLSEVGFRAVSAAFPDGKPPHIDQAPFANLGEIRSARQRFCDSLSRNSRHQLRRAIKLYEDRDGALSLARPATVAEALAYLDRLTDLHQDSWRARGKPGAFANPFFIDFHHRLVESAFDEGLVDLIEVGSAKGPIGYLYNFLYRGQALSYQSGFCFENDNRLKPGLVCHALAAQDYLDRGLDRYSFLAGDSRYKRSLATDSEPLYTVNVKARGPLARLLRRGS